MRLKHRFLVFVLSSFIPCFSQTVGVVLSGGGASGMAHIGVLKALEEQGIPIDYITGTSSGALVGALYAAGYTPEEMEKLVVSEKFKNWAYGHLDDRYRYFFKRGDADASWITFKFSLKSGFETLLPTNIINSFPVDFGLLETFSKASLASHSNFDSLLVPFRCVASNIDSNKLIVFHEGNLGESVRASMSYPFYLKPIAINGSLLFDGGLYNNFPVSIVNKEFHPDYLIGSNVTGALPPATDDNIVSQIRSMMTEKTVYSLGNQNGILIAPQTNVGLFDFDHNKALIDSGYAATMRSIAKIKFAVGARIDTARIRSKRAAFLKKEQDIHIGKIKVTGLKENQVVFVNKTILPGNNLLSLDELKSNYFKLVADERIKSIFPTIRYNTSTHESELNLRVKQEKEFETSFGGDFSNRPISEGFVGIRYNFLGTMAGSLYGDTYFGRLYSSVQAKARIDMPGNLPFFIEPAVTYNRWDYYNSSELFFENVKPAYLIQGDQSALFNLGIPLGNNGKLVGGAGYVTLTNQYYQTQNFTPQDTADRDQFTLFTSDLMYENNTLNRKMYPNEGHEIYFKVRYSTGQENNQPGSTEIGQLPSSAQREWLQIKGLYDNYFIYKGKYKLGILLEGMYSNQTLSFNYASSILAAPAFQPITETQTLFLENYMAYNYVAGGLKNIINFKKNFDLRLEGYVFAPYQSILENTSTYKAYYGGIFATEHYILSSSLVYTSPLGPVAISVNYYDRQVSPLTFMFHFGYTLFNRRALN